MRFGFFYINIEKLLLRLKYVFFRGIFNYYVEFFFKRFWEVIFIGNEFKFEIYKLG